MICVLGTSCPDAETLLVLICLYFTPLFGSLHCLSYFSASYVRLTIYSLANKGGLFPVGVGRDGMPLSCVVVTTQWIISFCLPFGGTVFHQQPMYVFRLPGKRATIALTDWCAGFLWLVLYRLLRVINAHSLSGFRTMYVLSLYGWGREFGNS